MLAATHTCSQLLEGGLGHSGKGTSVPLALRMVRLNAAMHRMIILTLALWRVYDIKLQKNITMARLPSASIALPALFTCTTRTHVVQAKTTDAAAFDSTYLL